MTRACPCGSERVYADCCGRLHAGEPAAAAEALMRARYSAYVLGLEAYVRRSWHPDTCPADLRLDPRVRWLGLKILHCHGGSAVDQEGSVEFVARHKHNGRAGRLHEVSRFVRVNGAWCYLDGEVCEEGARPRGCATK